MRESLNNELVQAANVYIGDPAVYHQKFSPVCLLSETTMSACWDQGVNRRGFDCSGFIIRSMCDVLDVPLEQWPMEMRHTRQLWQAAEEMKVAVPYTEAQPGDILTMHRLWTMPDNTHKTVLAHVGVMGERGIMVHAQARDGAVVARPPRTQKWMHGCIPFEGLVTIVKANRTSGTLDDRVPSKLS